ncbi:MAG: porin O [Planctomycetota bacterium]|nr:MAG: porin O [Planctomycetota bacterium]
MTGRRGRPGLGAAVLLGAVVLGAPLWAQTAPPAEQERLRALEQQADYLHEQVQQLRARLAERDRAAAQGPEFERRWGEDVVVAWKDGLRVYLLDPGEPDPERRPLHMVALDGRLQIDYRWFADEASPHDDTFVLRRIRLGVKGFFFRHLAYRLSADFARDGDTQLKDAYVAFTYLKAAQLMVGQFKTPMMLEQLASSKYLNFIELPMMQTVAQIDRDLGIQIHGELEYAHYQLAVMNGERGNRADSNDDKDLIARLVLTPFKPGKTPILEGLAIGGSISYGKRDDFLPVFRTISGTTFLDLGQASSDFQAGGLLRAGGEFLLVAGPLRLQAEYLHLRVADFVTGAGREGDLDVRGGYVDVLFMLTGEDYPYDRRVVPDSDFDPLAGGWGAWQVGFRWDVVDVEGRLASDRIRGTDRVDAFTFGLNWYLNRFVKVQANYTRIVYEDDTGVARIQSNEDVVFFRLALEY